VDQWAPPPVQSIEAHILHDPTRLFRHIAGAVAPLKDKNLADVARPVPAPRPIKREEDEREVLREALEAPLTFEDRLDIGDEAAYLRTGLPRRVLTDLRRGRWVVQGELDLHGLTRDEARASLARFIAASLQQGRRCLRVIHGKGHGSPGRVPVLKHLSRGWLASVKTSSPSARPAPMMAATVPCWCYCRPAPPHVADYQKSRYPSVH